MIEPRCAVASAARDEPLAGTAPEARAWLVVEQEGPWGRDALTESHLGAELGGALRLHADGTGTRVLLARRPGRHADHHTTPVRRVAWLASTVPGRTWLHRLDLDDPRELLALDLVAAAQGAEPDLGVADPEPLLLVCTNSRRDQCCALDGRAAVQAAAALHPGRVWECSHLGGHRFAATALVLPSGLVHGRLDGTSAGALLDHAGAGSVDLPSLRGRSTWSAAGQAAECDVRASRWLTGVDDVLDVTTRPGDDGTWVADLMLADGTVERSLVREVVDPDRPRAESCVKPAVPMRSLRVEPVGPAR